MNFERIHLKHCVLFYIRMFSKFIFMVQANNTGGLVLLFSCAAQLSVWSLLRTVTGSDFIGVDIIAKTHNSTHSSCNGSLIPLMNINQCPCMGDNNPMALVEMTYLWSFYNCNNQQWVSRHIPLLRLSLYPDSYGLVLEIPSLWERMTIVLYIIHPTPYKENSVQRHNHAIPGRIS